MEQLELEQSTPWTKKKLVLTVPQFVVGTVLVVALAFWGGTTAKGYLPFAGGLQPIYDTRAPEGVDLAPLFAAWHLLDDNFVAGTSTPTSTPQEKLWGAIQGLAAAYGDDYTVFFPPAQKEIFETTVRGDFEGVGMEIGKRDGMLTVVSPIKGTPAYAAGIKAGDIITKIDGTPSLDMPVDEAVTHIRGKKGTQVVLTLSRDGKDNGKEFDITVTRDTIVLPTLDQELRPDGVYVIQLYSFNAQSPELFAGAVQAFQRSGSDKLIVDLRGNPGGYLEAAVDIASWFLPSGDVVVTQDYGPKKTTMVYRSSGLGTLQSVQPKIVILIDGGSASASEIFAGALHDHGRATLVGQKSFGKGSVQQVFDVTDDTSLKVTIARWLTPNGVSISHQGIAPEIEVEITDEDREADKDPQLDRAVQFLLTGK